MMNENSEGQDAGADFEVYNKPVEKHSIEDFSDSEFKIINSPRSLEAMRYLGLGQLDLRLQKYEDIKEMFNEGIAEEKKMLEKIVKNNIDNHHHMIMKIKEKRAELIEKETEKKNKKQAVKKEMRTSQPALTGRPGSGLRSKLKDSQKNDTETNKSITPDKTKVGREKDSKAGKR